MKISTKLKSIRKALGYTQTEFANILELKQGSYSGIENAKAPLSDSVQRKLERSLNVNLEYLNGNDNNMFHRITPGVNTRVQSIINYYQIDLSTFANRVFDGDQKARSTFLDKIKSDKDIDLWEVNSISEVYLDVSRAYLLSGIGEMIISQSTTQAEAEEIAALKDSLQLSKKLIKMYEERISELEKVLKK